MSSQCNTAMTSPWPQIGDTVCITTPTVKVYGALHELLPHGIRVRFNPPLKQYYEGQFQVWSETVHWPDVLEFVAAPGAVHRYGDDAPRSSGAPEKVEEL